MILRHLGILLAGLALGLAGCSGSTRGSKGCQNNAECAPGEVCASSTCQKLCRSDKDCQSDAGTICTGDICTIGSRTAVPMVTSVNGDGVSDGASTHTANRTAGHLVIDGQHLDGASATLSDGTHQWDLTLCSTSSTELEAELPTGLQSGASYTLTVASQAGSCDTTLPVLQGEAGPTGPAGATGPTGPSGPTGPAGPAWLLGGASNALVSSLQVVASSDCGTSTPAMLQAYINRQPVGAQVPINSSTLATYDITVPQATFANEIDIGFLNGSCGTLTVDKIVINGTDEVPGDTANWVFYDKGYFFDHVDVAPATKTLTETGALRFLVGPQIEPTYPGCVVEGSTWTVQASDAGYDTNSPYRQAQTYSDAAGTSVDDTYLANPQGAFDTSTGIFTAPMTGFYQITIEIEGITDTSGRILVAASLNGATPAEIYDTDTLDTACPNCTNVSWSGIVYLHAGDTHRVLRYNGYAGIDTMVIGYHYMP